MQILNSKLMYSPSDIVTFLESEFGSWMDRWLVEKRAAGGAATLPGVADALPEDSIQRDKEDETAEVFKEEGLRHEVDFLARLRNEGRRIVEIPQDHRHPDEAEVATRQALKSGAEVIYQAQLSDGDLAGRADFLMKTAAPSTLGAHSYEVWDSKLAHSTKPYFLLQLCAYADMLEHIQGRRSEDVCVLLGTGAVDRHPTNRFFFYYRELRRAFLEFQEKFDAKAMPPPQDSRGYGRWSGLADAILRRQDHISLVARITRVQVRKLEKDGITTIQGLADAPSHVPRIADPVLARLRLQASLQLRSRGKDTAEYGVLPRNSETKRLGLARLPPASELDIYFDMEGFPLVQGGLEYLFGAAYPEGGRLQFRDWWAHDAAQEKRAFEEFVDWAHERWTRDPGMHIYHYAAYEVTALRRLMGRHGTREDKVDDLLRGKVFVDAYTVVRQGVAFGTEGYSLKDIEPVYRGKRAGNVTSAAGSVVAYHRWRTSGESQEWARSPMLTGIRDYNEDDCCSLGELVSWLRALQKREEITYQDLAAEAEEPKAPKSPPKPQPWHLLAAELKQEVDAGRVTDPEKRRVQELLADLLQFHWREAKPVFWKMYDQLAMTVEGLAEDADCLGGLTRTAVPPSKLDRSIAYEYSFDPDQDTRLAEGDKCRFAQDDLIPATVISLDRLGGRVNLKVSTRNSAPASSKGLIPYDIVDPEPIQLAIVRYVESWRQSACAGPAVDQLLARAKPRIHGHPGGPLMRGAGDFTAEACDVIARMDRTVLCVQGPPGTGKTTLAAAAIVRLVAAGKRVGVTATGHKTILNLLRAVHEAKRKAGGPAIPLFKVGGERDHPLIADGSIRALKGGEKAFAALPAGPVVVGGTAWFFCHEDAAAQFDYLFVDEGGQFSLANVVGCGLAATNIVLVGDQMQLAQPIQGTHPGESGQSALDYLLQKTPTVPPDIGIFLPESRRMHPDVCSFISEAVYQGRLKSAPATAAHRLHLTPPPDALIRREAGIVFLPVPHQDNSLGSPEEVEVVARVVRELLEARVQDGPGAAPRPMTLNDVLFVAPFNVQVRALATRLGSGARVGSVDKFQGQEAHVVVVSMCSSTLEDSPRGADFLLNPNRVNVAVSRARTLAVVVASPSLLTARCSTVEEMELVNLLCWLKARGQSGV